MEATTAGRLDLAIRNCTEALAIAPGLEPAAILRAQLSVRNGQVPLAIQGLREFLAINGDSYSASCELAATLRVAGRLPEASEVAHRSIADHPQEVRAHVELGLIQAAGQQFVDAVTTLTRATRITPNDGRVFFHLGSALRLLGRDDEAIEALQSAVRLEPDNAAGLVRLGQTLLARGSRVAAIDCFAKALAIDPNIAEAHMMWAEALIEEGQDAEADSHLERAAQLDPSTSTSRGFRLEVLGRFDEARACFERALDIRPWDGGAYYGLVSTSKVTQEDISLVGNMLRWASDSRVSPQDAIFFQYALGKAFEDLGDPQRAMSHFREANGLAARQSKLEFDPALHSAYVDWRVQTFTKDFLAGHRSAGHASDSPIFVIGMIRSGTTLVEQALSSHPLIGGGGELRYWYERQASFNEEIAHGSLDHARLRAESEGYLSVLSELCPRADRVVDKMPMNFLLLGLVHLAFPNARIIHCRRNPLDNCLSIYTTYFDTSPPYAHVPENICFYYQEYERLMAHWREVLPADRFIETDYEAFVSDREAELRRLVDFADLPWDDACMHHEANARPVRTPSVWQVRQPIYSSSVERWRRFEPWLEGFEALMPGVRRVP